MINDEIQNQQSGDNSFNCQAGGNITIINNGITQENVKQIFMEMFKANMPKLREIAKEEANKSAEQVSDSIALELTKLNETNSEIILKRLADADMQIALIETQKNYAKYPDANKLEQLTKLFLSKGLETRISLRNMMLDEAINTVAKMSQAQIDFLSYIVQKFTFIADVKTAQELYKKYLKKILFFSTSFDKLTLNDINYLDYLNCIKNRPYKIIDNDIVSVLKKQYSHILGSNSNIKNNLCQIDIGAKELIEKDLNLPSIDLTPLGILIGIKNIEIKTNEIINWNF